MQRLERRLGSRVHVELPDDCEQTTLPGERPGLYVASRAAADEVGPVEEGQDLGHDLVDLEGDVLLQIEP